MRTAPLVLALVLLVPSASADYLQRGYDAGRSGDVPEKGPIEYEVALKFSLPGARAYSAPPLIIGDDVYVLVRALYEGPLGGDPGRPEGLTENALYRIDTQTGAEPEQVVLLDAVASALASDGERLFIAEADRLAAYDLEGTELWTWPWPDILPPTDTRHTACAPLAVFEGDVYAACTQSATGDVEPEDWVPDRDVSAIFADEHASGQVFAARLDGSEGTEAWVWEAGTESAELEDPILVQPKSRFRATGLAVTDDRVLVTVQATHPFRDGDEHHTVYGLDGEGRYRSQLALLNAPTTNPTGLQPYFATPAVAITGMTAYIQTSDLRRVDLGKGDLSDNEILVEATQGLPNGDRRFAGRCYCETGLVVRPSEVYFQGYESMRKWDEAAQDVQWEQRLERGEWRDVQPLLAGGLLYVLSRDEVTVFDARGATGTVLWTHELDRTEFSTPYADIAVAGGLFVVADAFGHTTVFGRTAASIAPNVTVSSLYPAVGEDIAVDLTGSTPGSGDGPLRYRATWGDGAVTTWQDDPVLTHAYSDPGERVARITVGDVDGTRWSTEAITFSVGGTPPEELNVVQKAFEPANYDLTFGILGILIAIVGGLIAILRTRRRHGRLQRELAAIDAAAEAAVGNPGRLSAAMDERRAHCHGLLLDHKLDEAQFAVLERHIEAVGRGARMDQMRELFDFLPYAMVRALEEMLADGRITAWERESFHGLLERNEVLSRAQKRKVGALIDDWFAEDEGGGA